MVRSNATSPQQYIEELPSDRREAIGAVRQIILQNLPAGFEEGMLYGMIGYYIPLQDFPDTYNGQPISLLGLASQKNYMALYLNSVYSDPVIEKWFQERYAASGKKLKMGKSCVYFKKLEDLPLDLIGEVVAKTSRDEFLSIYKHALKTSQKAK